VAAKPIIGFTKLPSLNTSTSNPSLELHRSGYGLGTLHPHNNRGSREYADSNEVQSHPSSLAEGLAQRSEGRSTAPAIEITRAELPGFIETHTNWPPASATKSFVAAQKPQGASISRLIGLQRSRRRCSWAASYTRPRIIPTTRKREVLLILKTVCSVSQDRPGLLLVTSRSFRVLSSATFTTARQVYCLRAFCDSSSKTASGPKSNISRGL